MITRDISVAELNAAADALKNDVQIRQAAGKLSARLIRDTQSFTESALAILLDSGDIHIKCTKSLFRSVSDACKVVLSVRRFGSKLFGMRFTLYQRAFNPEVTIVWDSATVGRACAALSHPFYDMVPTHLKEVASEYPELTDSAIITYMNKSGAPISLYKQENGEWYVEIDMHAKVLFSDQGKGSYKARALYESYIKPLRLN